MKNTRQYGWSVLSALLVIVVLAGCGGGAPAPTMPADLEATSPATTTTTSPDTGQGPTPYPPPVVRQPQASASNPYPEPVDIEGKTTEEIITEAEKLLEARNRDKIRQALNLLNAAIASEEGGNPDLRLFAARGKAYLLQRDFEKARRDLAWVLYYDPENLDARLSRSKLFYRIGNVQGGLDDLAFVLEQQPDNIEALLQRATIYGSSNLDQALNDLDRVLELQPDNARAYALRARLYADAGQLENAEADYQKAISLDPTEVEASYEYGMLLLSRGRVDEAREQFRAVMEHGTSSLHGDVMMKASTQLKAIGSDNNEQNDEPSSP